MWIALLVVALLWPGRGISALDGIPLDRWFEALIVGAVVPALWWLHPSFGRHLVVRSAIVVLVVLKIADATLLTQQGWCLRFETARLYEDGPAVQTSWDGRADWRSSVPVCSAIMARPFISFTRFPVWFLNLQDTRPPRVPVRVIVDGYLRASGPGMLTFDVRGTTAAPAPVSLAAGVSHVQFDGVFNGSDWALVPRWNGRDVFSAVATTRLPPTSVDRVLGAVLPAATAVLAVGLIALWFVGAMFALTPSLSMLAWMTTATVACALAGALDFDRVGRLTVALLLVPIVLSTPERLRNVRGAFLLIGVPWLALLIAGCLGHAGRISMYSVGDDWTTFQRFAHRIYVQGYWLEGGERGFWQQPLYRWIAGALHVGFGDSSIGEMFLDAAALLAGALFAFDIVRRVVGFRMGVAAGALTLLTVAFGPNWHVIGRGLSDAVAAGLIYLAARLAIDLRDRPLATAFAAGVAATLAFYTRLNHLPVILAILALMLPLSVRARSIVHVRQLWRSLPLRHAAVYLACIGAGVVALMARTWHYLGAFSVFAGTTRLHQATGLGLTASSFVSAEAWRRAFESVAMIVTVQDPPGLNVRAILVIGGVVCAMLALLQVPTMRELPLGVVLFCVAALSGGFVARGAAYTGRFSLQLIPIAIAVAVCALGTVWLERNRQRGQHEQVL